MSLPRAVSLVLPLIGLAVVMSAPVLAQSRSAATMPAGRKYSINYKDNLFSIREEGGPYLFAQTLQSPTATACFDIDGVHPAVKVSLQDAKGSKLWSSDLSDPILRRGMFNAKWNADGGIMLDLTREATDNTEDQEPGPKGHIIFTLRSDNVFLNGELKAGKDGARFQRLADGNGIEVLTYADGKPGDKTVLHFDPKNPTSVTAEVNGQQVASINTDTKNSTVTLTDASGAVTLRTLKRDGKDYTEVQLGERRLLIEGGSINAQSKDGVIVLTLTPSPTTTKP